MRNFSCVTALYLITGPNHAQGESWATDWLATKGFTMLRELLGMPEGILKELRQDHDEVSSLIEELIESEAPEERALLFKEIKTKLLAHSQAEQAVLYRKMEKSKD